ncbi:MAG TPA: hypothetical protein VFK05_11540 [Polyangiaceae bacterium]|nr:hypothetical protein [Polyangiaceae bacterium]
MPPKCAEPGCDGRTWSSSDCGTYEKCVNSGPGAHCEAALTPNLRCGSNSRCDANVIVTCSFGTEIGHYDCGSQGCTQKDGIAQCSNEVDCVGGYTIGGVPNAHTPIGLCGSPQVCGAFVAWERTDALPPADGGSIVDGRYTLRQAFFRESVTPPTGARVRAALTVEDGQMASLTDDDGATLTRSGRYSLTANELQWDVECERGVLSGDVAMRTYSYGATPDTLTLRDRETNFVYVYARVQ